MQPCRISVHLPPKCLLKNDEVDIKLIAVFILVGLLFCLMLFICPPTATVFCEQTFIFVIK